MVRPGAEFLGAMSRRAAPWAIMLAGALACGGCVSARVTTSLKPASDPALKSAAGSFYVAAVELADTAPNQPPMVREMMARRERAIEAALRRECPARYPLLFASEPANAIPLGVTLTVTTRTRTGQTLGWMLGTLLLAGTIFPCPGDTIEDYTVSAAVWSPQGTAPGAGVTSEYQRTNYTWVTLLTPLGLIRRPGETDFPKKSGTIFNMAALEKDYCGQIAQQSATALAQMVAPREAAYWRAAPAQQTAPTTVPGIPTALPPPGGTDLPY